MKISKRRICMLLGAIGAAAAVGNMARADNYYFRLRPSIQILNQETFSVRIDGDRAGVVGSSFAAKAEASAPRETLRFEVESGNLPPGVALNSSSGAITGRPTAAGRFSATIIAHDAFSTATAPYSATIYDALEIETTVSQYATVGKPYSASFKGVGGDGNYAWSLSGTPPTGLSLGSTTSATNALSGTPTTAGTWGGLVVNLADGAGHSATTSPFSVSVADPLKISGVASGIATIGVSYSASFTSSGGHAPIAWTLSGTLPDGLAFNDGAISGTPTKAGTASSLVVRVADNAGNVVASDPFSIAVSQPLSVAGTPANFGTVGVSYSATLTAAGGDGNYRWESVGGSLPTGLNFVNGIVSGQPTEAGTWSNIALRVTDGNGRTIDTNPFSIVVSSPLAISGSSSFIATVGVWTYTDFAISGGDGNYKVSVLSGTEPRGFYSVNGPNDGYGFYRGTATSAGTFSNIVLRVTDGNGRTADSNPFSITVYNGVTASGAPPAPGTVGVYQATASSASGGSGGYTWASVGSALPLGLYVSSDGVIYGTPSSAGTWNNIVLRATDSQGRIADTAAMSLTVYNPVSISGSAPVGTVGAYYSATYAASGGNGSYNWSIVGGSLPQGLNLSGGTIYGTPANEGWISVTLQAADTQGRVRTVAVSAYVYSQVYISGALASSGKVGTYYSSTVYAGGGTGSYNWSVIGTLPPGLYPSGGTVYGTPTTAGTWYVALQAVDGHGRSAQTGTMTISVAPSIIREPSSGEYYSDPTYGWGMSIFGIGNIVWNGQSIPIQVSPDTTQYSYGGATYYRGSLVQQQLFLSGYAVYRTIP